MTRKGRERLLHGAHSDSSRGASRAAMRGAQTDIVEFVVVGRLLLLLLRILSSQCSGPRSLDGGHIFVVDVAAAGGDDAAAARTRSARRRGRRRGRGGNAAQYVEIVVEVELILIRGRGGLSGRSRGGRAGASGARLREGGDAAFGVVAEGAAAAAAAERSRQARFGLGSRTGLRARRAAAGRRSRGRGRPSGAVGRRCDQVVVCSCTRGHTCGRESHRLRKRIEAFVVAVSAGRGVGLARCRCGCGCGCADNRLRCSGSSCLNDRRWCKALLRLHRRDLLLVLDDENFFLPPLFSCGPSRREHGLAVGRHRDQRGADSNELR